MPDQLTIVCPHCSFLKDVLKSAIPAGARQVTCPKCKQAFALNSETMRPTTAPQSDPVTGSTNSPSSSSTDTDGVQPPRAPLQSPSVSQPAPRTLAFSFQGSARDYFGIWIVNTLLKMVTVGFYSAWAKVRNRRFFFGSTTLHGQPFEYLADPLALFKGWLIAAAAFILYSISVQISPILSGVVGLLIFIAFPWLVVRSRIFNAINSSYRNIRFGFRPDYRQAYVVFAGLPILMLLSLGLLAPYMLYRQKKFMVENSSYGSTPFTFSATVKDFYLLSFKIVLGFVALGALIGATIAMAGGWHAAAAGSSGRGAPSGLVLVPLLSFFVIYFIVIVYAQTALANLSWNNTRLGNNNGIFRSTLRTRDMVLLFVTNGLAIMFSLGLLVPWATIRLTRYRFERLELESLNGLDGILAAAGSRSAVGATGEEIGDLFDMSMDIAL